MQKIYIYQNFKSKKNLMCKPQFLKLFSIFKLCTGQYVVVCKGKQQLFLNLRNLHNVFVGKSTANQPAIQPTKKCRCQRGPKGGEGGRRGPKGLQLPFPFPWSLGVQIIRRTERKIENLYYCYPSPTKNLANQRRILFLNLISGCRQ